MSRTPVAGSAAAARAGAGASPSQSRQLVQFALASNGAGGGGGGGVHAATGAQAMLPLVAGQSFGQKVAPAQPPLHPRTGDAGGNGLPAAAPAGGAGSPTASRGRSNAASTSSATNSPLPRPIPLNKRNQSSRARGDAAFKRSGELPPSSPTAAAAAAATSGASSAAPSPSVSPAPMLPRSGSPGLGTSSPAQPVPVRRVGLVGHSRSQSRSVHAGPETGRRSHREPSRSMSAHPIRPALPAGAFVQRQSPNWVQPPDVDPLTTPLVVLCSLTVPASAAGGSHAPGTYLASLDVSNRYERDRVLRAGLCALETNAKGMVLTGAADGWRLFNPNAQLSEAEKTKRRIAAAATTRAPSAGLEREGSVNSALGGSGSGGGGNGGHHLNKYDSNGVLVEDEFGRARVFATAAYQGQHHGRASMVFSGAAVAAITAAAAGSPTAAGGVAPSPTAGGGAGSASLPLTSTCWLSDGRFVTADSGGMLRLFADEAHRFRMLAEQDLSLSLSSAGDGHGHGHGHESQHYPLTSQHKYSSPSSSGGSLLPSSSPTLVLALEDGRLLTAQDSTVFLHDEVLQQYPGAPAFRLDKTYTYTSSESVAAIAGLKLAAMGEGEDGGVDATMASSSSSGRPASSSAASTPFLSSLSRENKEDPTIKCLLPLPQAGQRGWLLTGHADRTIQVLDLFSFSLRSTLHGHLSMVTCMLEMLDGRVASGSADFNIKIWSIEASRCDLTLRGHTGPILSLCTTWSANTLVSSGADQTIRLWNLATGTCEVVWNIPGQGIVEQMRLLPVPPTCRDELEEGAAVGSAADVAELAAIEALIREERERTRSISGNTPRARSPPVATAGATSGAAESTPTVAPLPAGAFAHLGLAVPFRKLMLDEKDTTSASAAASPTSATTSATAAAGGAAGPQQNYSSRMAPVDGSLFASSARPPAVSLLAAVAPEIQEKDALIRAQAAPHYAVPAPIVARAAPVPSIADMSLLLASSSSPTNKRRPQLHKQVSEGSTYEDDFEVPHGIEVQGEQEAAAGKDDGQSGSGSNAISPPVAVTTAAETAASNIAGPASPTSPTSSSSFSRTNASASMPLSPTSAASPSHAHAQARLFDRSSAVERAVRAAALVASASSRDHSPERRAASEYGFGGAEEDASPSRPPPPRIPASVLAASLISYPSPEALRGADPLRPLRAAPFIDALADFSPQQLTHIIHEQHRRARHEANHPSSSVDMLKSSTNAGDYSPARRSSRSPLPRPSHWLDPSTPILAHHALGGGATEEKECLSPASLRDRALQQSLSAARLHRRGGGGKRSNALTIAEEEEAEEQRKAAAKPKLSKAQRQAAIDAIVSRVASATASAGSPSKQRSHVDGGGGSAPKVHVLARGRPRVRDGDTAANVFLTSVDAEDGEKQEQQAGQQQDGAPPEEEDSKWATPSPERRRARTRSSGSPSVPHYPSVASFLPSGGARSPSPNKSSSSSLSRSRSEARYMVGGVALSPPPAKGVAFNKALYGHLLDARPNPNTGGLIFKKASGGGGRGLGAYTHEEGNPALARTQGLAGSGTLGRSSSLPALTHPAAGLLTPSPMALALARPVSKKTQAFVARMQADAEHRRASSPEGGAAGSKSNSPTRAGDKSKGLAATAPVPVTFVPVADPTVPVLERVAANAALRAESRAARQAARKAARDAPRAAADEAYNRRVAEQRALKSSGAAAGAPGADGGPLASKKALSNNLQHHIAQRIQQRLQEDKKGEKAVYVLHDTQKHADDD